MGFKVNGVIVHWFNEVSLYSVKNNEAQTAVLSCAVRYWGCVFKLAPWSINSAKHMVGVS